LWGAGQKKAIPQPVCNSKPKQMLLCPFFAWALGIIEKKGSSSSDWIHFKLVMRRSGAKREWLLANCFFINAGEAGDALTKRCMDMGAQKQLARRSSPSSKTCAVG
jgi:hypothetical protein